MDHSRRQSDQDFFRKWWDKLTPWIQIGTAIITVGYFAGTYLNRFEAYADTLDKHAILLVDHEKRLNIIDDKLDRISQRLDDIMEFWHIPVHNRPD